MKAIDIANYIVQLANYEGHPISNLMLQKILYFVQGISIVRLGKPAFEDDIIAWAAGPMVKEPYYRYWMHGCLNIYQEPTEEVFNKVPSELRRLIRAVYHKAITYSVTEMVKIILNKNTPWHKAYHRGCDENGSIIFKAELEDYFKKHYIGE